MDLEPDLGGAPSPVADATPSSPVPSAPAVDTTEASGKFDRNAIDDNARTIDDSLAKVWAKNNPARAEDGKFAAREQPPAPALDKPAVEAKPEAEAKTAVAPVVSAIEAPRAWNAEQKAIWAKLPPEAQPIIAAREQELQQIKSEHGRITAEYQPLKQVVDGYQPYFRATGIAPQEWMRNALEASVELDSGPERAAVAIKELARMSGVDLASIYDPLEAPPSPRELALERENQRLRQYEQQAAASSNAAAEQAVQRAIDEFVAANPDAKEIEADVAAEIQVIKAREPNLDHAATLKKAFERAAWLNENARAKRLDAEVKARETARIAAAKEAATKARSAGAVNVSGSPSQSNGNADDYEASMRSIWRKNANR